MVVGLPIVVLLTLVCWFLSSKTTWLEKTYCRKCGALKEVRVSHWTGYEQRNIIDIPSNTYAGFFTSGSCKHEWIQPPNTLFADETDWSNQRRIHNRAVMEKYYFLRDCFEGNRKDLFDGLLALGHERARKVWLFFLDPANHLSDSVLYIFATDTAKESQWAVWSMFIQHYRCTGTHSVSCAVEEPARLELYKNSGLSMQQLIIDWKTWSPGLPPLPSVFSVDSFTPADDAEEKRARALVKKGLEFVGIDLDSIPTGARYATEGTYQKPEGEVDTKLQALVDRRYGLHYDFMLGDKHQEVFYARGKGVRIENGSKDQLEPLRYHYMERDIRSFSPAVTLALAMDPEAKLRHLGIAERGGRSVERVLVTLENRYSIELYLDPATGEIVAERVWTLTFSGTDMVTTFYEDWRPVSGIMVPFLSRSKRMDKRYGQQRVVIFEWNPVVDPPDFQP